jgi:hypothetical protein
MGYWDAQLLDLVPLGIRLSGDQVEVLENGGEVLALWALPDPLHADHGCDAVYPSTSDTVVVLALPMQVYGPNEVYGTFDGKAMTYAQFADEEFSQDWRRYPTYLGEQENPVSMFNPTALVRVWSGRPTNPARLDRFRMAGYQTVRNTGYETLLTYVLAENELYDLGFTGENTAEIEDFEEYETYLVARKELTAAGVLDEKGSVQHYPPIPQFVDMLTEQTDKDFYNALVLSSRLAVRSVLAAQPPNQRSMFAYAEGDYDPWY